jgi:hypothetical protein
MRRREYLFRIHIRPSGGSASMPVTFAYCLKEKILGVGWRSNSGRNTKDLDEYYNEAKIIHPNLDVCKYIKQYASEGDLIWAIIPDLTDAQAGGIEQSDRPVLY